MKQVEVFVRRGRKVVFDHTIVVERSRSNRRNNHSLVAADTAFQFDCSDEKQDFSLSPRLARMAQVPHSTRVALGWEFGMRRDFDKPRSWKDWRGEQYRH